MVKETDYCSLSPDWIKKYLFFGKKTYYLGNACKAHDIAYAQPDFTATKRLKADRALKNGIRDALPFFYKWIAHLYYVAVRIFGRIYEKGFKKKLHSAVIRVARSI